MSAKATGFAKNKAQPSREQASGPAQPNRPHLSRDATFLLQHQKWEYRTMQSYAMTAKASTAATKVSRGRVTPAELPGVGC